MRKILAGFLSFALLFNSVIIQCFAEASAETVADVKLSDDEKAAFKLLEALGVIEDSADRELDSKVTRAEYAKYLARILRSTESFNTGVYYFNDAKDDIYVNSLAATGILNGNGTGSFYPDENIIGRDALLTIFRATGYEEYVKQTGNHSGNYLLVAKKLGLSCGTDLNAELTYRRAIKLLYEMSLVPLYDIKIIESDSIIYGESKNNILSMHWDTYHKNGRVTANRFTSLYNSESACNIDEIRIGAETYYINDEEPHSYLGMTVDAYYTQKGNGGKKNLLCIIPREEENDVLVIEAEDIISFADNKLVYYQNGSDRRKEIKFPDSLAIVYNGKAETDDYEQLFKPKNGEITLYKGNGGNYDVAIIREFVNTRITAVDSSNESIFTDGEGRIAHLSVGAYTEGYVRIRNNTSNLTHNFAHLLKGDVISVIVSRNSDYIEIYKCSDKVTGNIESIDNVSGGSITIGGEKYDFAEGYTVQAGIGPGMSVTISKDIKGNVAGCEIKVLSEEFLYGYLFGLRRDGVLSVKVTAGIYNELQEYLMLDFAKRVNVDGNTMSAQEAADALCGSAGTFVRQVIRYKLNKKGEIQYIDTAAKTVEAMEGEGTLLEIAPVATRNYYSKDMLFDKMYPIHQSVTEVMFVPEVTAYADVKEFGFVPVERYAPFAVDGVYRIGMYTTNPKNPVAEFVTYQLAGSSSTYFQNLIMVSEVANVLDEQGTDIYEISGYANYTKVTLRTAPGCTTSITLQDGTKITGTAKDIKPGDVFHYTMNAAGEVTSAAIRVSFENDLIQKDYKVGNIRNIYKAAGNTQSLIEIVGKLGDGENASDKPLMKYSIFYANKVKFVIYDSQRRVDPVYIGTIDDIRDATGDGRGDMIYIYTLSEKAYERTYFVWKSN